MTRHLTETELALMAGGDCSPVSRFFLDRHLRKCTSCVGRMTEFAILRDDIAGAPIEDPELAHLSWEGLSAEMTANIHLGLEAGQCVRRYRRQGIWNPKLAVAFASLTVLLGAGFLMRAPHSGIHSQQIAGKPVLNSTETGLELRKGSSSLTLMNHHGAVTDQTVSAQGEIRASYVDSGAVTFNVVYLE